MNEAKPFTAGRENSQMFLEMIGSLPPETRNRYLSAYTDFLALPIDKQNDFLRSLETIAKEVVGPKITEDRKRLNEDTDYEVEAKERAKRQLQQSFNKLVGQMDFNKNRDIAKTNESAAKVMQNVANTAFVTNVAGSGIFSRRTYYVKEQMQDKTEDINVDYNQNYNKLALQKGQAEQDLDAQIGRLYSLNERGNFDLDQKQKEDELAVFLELYGSKIGQIGEQNSQILEAGGGQAASVGQTVSNAQSGTASALSDYLAGGTDQQRRTRQTEQDRVKNAIAEKSRIDAISKRYEDAANTYMELADYRDMLSRLGRDTTEVDSLMNQLLPYGESLARAAQRNEGSLFGGSGSGIPNFKDEVNRRLNYKNEGRYTKDGRKYGDYDQSKVLSALDSFDYKSLFDRAQGIASLGFEEVPRENVYGKTEADQNKINPYTAPQYYSQAAPQVYDKNVSGDAYYALAEYQGPRDAQGRAPATQDPRAKAFKTPEYRAAPDPTPTKPVTASNNPGTSITDRAELRKQQRLANR